MCKAWYALACPFLYEYIILGRNRALAPLCAALSKTAQEKRQVGRWTKRLDVRMWDTTETPSTVLATLADILTYLPNLCILTFSITGHSFFNFVLPNVVLNSITTSGSLKCVRWYNSITRPSPQPWTEFLQKHPEIEVLDGGQGVLLNAHIKLDAVKILHGYPIWTEQYGTTWSEVDLPAVRSMFCDFHYGTEIDDDTFGRLGHNLTNIQLSSFDLFPDSRLTDIFAQIRKRCAHLTQLVLAVRSWSLLVSYIPTLPPTVHILGIRVMNEQISPASVQRLFTDLLPSYITPNPAIKTIKFMEKKNSQALRSHSVSLWHGLRVMEKLGVAVKDLHDRPIVPPSCSCVAHLQQELDTLSSTSTLDAPRSTS